MDDCVFCQVAADMVPSWKVYETAHSCAFLNIHPVNPYHTLVIPKRHYRDIFDVPPHELQCLVELLKYVVDLYARKLGLAHAQIVNSSDVEAQQDVFHVHFLIVPRHAGDGQDVVWETHPEMRQDFDAMLSRLE